VKRIGVIGSMVWDTIHGRDPMQPAIEEWGGIAYALAGLDAALGDDWRLVPLIKVGRDLAPRAAAFLREEGARLVGIDSLNIDDISGGARPVHSTLLRHDIPIVEHMRGLAQLPNAGFKFFAVPVKVRGLGSFPVRAFAQLESGGGRSAGPGE